MKRAALAALCCLTATAAAAEPHPLAQAEVGDWAAFDLAITVTMGPMDMNYEGKVKTILARRDENVAVVVNETSMEMLGTKEEGRYKENVAVGGAFDLFADIDAQIEGMAVVEDTQGEETLETPAGAFACRWRAVEATFEQEGEEGTLSVKMWVAPDAPMMRVVKTSLTIAGDGHKMTSALTLAGKGAGAVVDDLDAIPTEEELLAERQALGFEPDDGDFEDDGDDGAPEEAAGPQTEE